MKQLKKLGDKQFFEDVKRYIKSSHSFYETRAPELKILANKLHEEYNLKEFYKVFNKFWNNNSPKEATLAIYTLQLYKDDFDIETWRFIKQKIKGIKSIDKIDSISLNIIGEIIIKYPNLNNEIINFSCGKDLWLKRMAIISAIPSVRIKNLDLALKLIELHLNDKGESTQKAIGILLKEIGEIKPELLRRIILKNQNMPLTTFFYATENMKELRRYRETDNDRKFDKLFFWRDK